VNQDLRMLSEVLQEALRVVQEGLEQLDRRDPYKRNEL
jgi:hypothetical protein